MDTTRDIIYRNFKLNDSAVQASIDASDGTGKGISGSVVDDFDPDDLDVVQFMEKRAEADGMDVGNPFLGGRRIRISGTAYGKTRGLLYDNLLNLRAALSPILAAREIPGDKGYLPLYFSIPTADTANFPTGVKDLRALAMPKSFRAPLNRDRHGGADTDALALNWTAIMVMRDPSFEGVVPQDVVFSDSVVTTGATATASTDLVNKTSHGLNAGDRIFFTKLTGGTGLALNTSYYVPSAGLTANAFKVSTTSGTGGSPVNILTDYSTVEFSKYRTISGNFNNRGTYVAPLNMIMAVGSGAGTITVVAGSSNFTITIPASTGVRIIRFKREKVITVEEGGVESLRRSWLNFTANTTWPLIPPGVSAYTITINGTTLDPGTVDGSHMWFWESYA
jgi:hypothetical protein